ncbi:ATP-binding protein [Streptomyces sp. DSM 42041]|uniref:ATP-binding protein n=1 Tax=Streptomyces hazeniae TaxID=3075538 RepID=A0ABU2NXI2_9ACTN|nr:ATP-binding protein [Streptomyces sp. DSM 42041]MDT0381217.1 ATP-binding protein [Streptomyces sp. DSM 42041]
MSRDSRPSRHCAVEFQALPSRIGQVRRIVSAQLRYWHLDPLIDRVALGLTELLANVHQHAGPDKHCTVEMVFLWDRLTVSVRDHDPQLPSLRVSDTSATHGRGLALVAALSDSWGIREQHDGSGKVVWFTLPAPFTAPAEPVFEAAAAEARPEAAGTRAAAVPAAVPAADDAGPAPLGERRPRAQHA